MKAVIFAGGFGTRLAEETSVKPKPMVEVGSKPILWHIMKIYSSHGINDFIICCGYKGHVIKEYFANYFLHRSNVTFDLRNNEMQVHHNDVEPWRVTLVDTGETTLKGGRLRRVRDYIGDDTFCLTYGDGVSNVNITELLDFHRKQKVLVTLTAVQPPGRFGAFTLDDGEAKVTTFKEKPQGGGAWVNGGYFVVEPKAIDYIEDESERMDWEKAPLETIAAEGKLAAYRHSGFWHPMDTLRDNQVLEKMWNADEAPWKVWG